MTILSVIMEILPNIGRQIQVPPGTVDKQESQRNLNENDDQFGF